MGEFAPLSRSRQQLGLTGGGPRLVITDLGVLRPDPDSLELVLTAKSIDIEISPILRADNFQFWRRTRLADLMGLQ